MGLSFKMIEGKMLVSGIWGEVKLIVDIENVWDWIFVGVF